MQRILGIICMGLSLSGGCAAPGAPGGPPGLSWVPTFVSCEVFSPRETALYVLPYAVGTTFKISRTFGHYLPGNGGVGLYAVDIPMPMRTEVLAMRAGEVVAVEERFSDDDRATFHENWVMVRHADGTVARYIHLTQGGAAVEVGHVVAQGELIGWSGNSGPSTDPHLHVDVQTCGPNLPPGYNDAPCGMTKPLSFRNTQPQVCGLEPGRMYTAQPFTPQER